MNKKLTIEFYFNDDEGCYRHDPIEKLIDKIRLQLIKDGMFIEKNLYEVCEVETHIPGEG